MGRKIVNFLICLTTLTVLTKLIFWTKNGTEAIKFSLLTTLTTKKLFLFIGVQKLVKNAEQVLQVLLAKNFKNSGKQVLLIYLVCSASPHIFDHISILQYPLVQDLCMFDSCMMHPLPDQLPREHTTDLTAHQFKETTH